MDWQKVSTAPLNTPVLLKRQFRNHKTPLIVVGEVVVSRRKKYHLWNGAYCDVVDLFCRYQPSWDAKFTHWAPL